MRDEPHRVGALRRQVERAWQRAELRWLGAILVLAAALRIAWVLYAARVPLGVHDPEFYYGYGQSIANGLGYTLPDGPTAYYPIGYPATLGALYFLVGHTPIPDNLPLATGFFQVFLSVATVALVYYLGRRLFTPAVGLLAALWMALFPNLIFHTATYLTETLFIFLVLAALAVLFSFRWRDERPGWARLLVFGVLMGFSALVRPVSLLFLPLLPIVWLIAGFGWQRALGYSGAVLVITAAVITPWTIRNIVRMDALVIISANLGDNLCMGNYTDARGHFALPERCFSEEEYAGLVRPEFEVKRNNDNTRKAVSFILKNPRFELKLLSRKAYYIWNHDHDGLASVESYGDDPFIGANLSLVILPDKVPDDQFFFILQGVERLTGLDYGELVDQVIDARANAVEELVVLENLDPETARLIQEEVLFGVRVRNNSSLRAALEGIADVFFFVTISLGGLGLVGFVLPLRRPRRIFFLLVLLALAGIPLVFFGDARFHVPVLPFLAVSAAWAVLAAGDVVTGGRRSGFVEVADGELSPPEQDALEDAQADEEGDQGAAALADER
ncbi:MAG: glycosyltransferase family 39 protein [Chloroflexi bacterium]|nr:glycosyltransferase family 39 protein [Chloroflexota bacterium]